MVPFNSNAFRTACVESASASARQKIPRNVMAMKALGYLLAEALVEDLSYDRFWFSSCPCCSGTTELSCRVTIPLSRYMNQDEYKARRRFA
jgi:hypothetical protein